MAVLCVLRSAYHSGHLRKYLRDSVHLGFCRPLSVWKQIEKCSHGAGKPVSCVHENDHLLRWRTMHWYRQAFRQTACFETTRSSEILRGSVEAYSRFDLLGQKMPLSRSLIAYSVRCSNLSFQPTENPLFRPVPWTSHLNINTSSKNEGIACRCMYWTH